VIFNDVEPEHLGGGVVVFRDALSWDDKKVISWVERELQAEQAQMYTPAVNPETGENAFLNKSGYYFDADTVEQMPRRASQIHRTIDTDFKEFLDFLESSRDKYLLKYLLLFPMAYKNIWWKVKGHVVSYRSGVYLGAHSDTSADYVYGLPEPSDQLATRNTTTVLIYLNNCVESDGQSACESFSGGHHYFNYLDIDITPKTGDVIMFPANYMATHEVLPVTSGVRYSYLGWYAHGTPNPATNEHVVDPASDSALAASATNVYMPSLRNDFIALVKDSNKEVSIPGFSFKEYHAD
jgi:hypothetical protein